MGIREDGSVLPRILVTGATGHIGSELMSVRRERYGAASVLGLTKATISCLAGVCRITGLR
ncbi:MAG: hypothetical protein Q7W05_05410 [Deltaproteobacteria bacterium]|nr:hypothetical protein [Deltaproteobacteria bacterium]